MLEADGVLDETGGEGLFQGAELAVGEAGNCDLDLKIAEMEGTRGGLGADANGESLRVEAVRGEVLRHNLTDATAERGEEEFGRRHPLVGSAVFYGLVEDDAMVAGLGSET